MRRWLTRQFFVAFAASSLVYGVSDLVLAGALKWLVFDPVAILTFEVALIFNVGFESVAFIPITWIIFLLLVLVLFNRIKNRPLEILMLLLMLPLLELFSFLMFSGWGVDFLNKVGQFSSVQWTDHAVRYFLIIFKSTLFASIANMKVSRIDKFADNSARIESS